MRSEGQVRHQLKQVIYRHRQYLLRENFRKLPERCRHNVEAQKQTFPIRICGYPTETRPKFYVCDPRLDWCVEQARVCRWWEACKTREEIKNEFQRLITSPDRGPLAAAFPDIAALMWVLDNSAVEQVDLIAILAESEAERSADGPKPEEPKPEPKPEEPVHE